MESLYVTRVSVAESFNVREIHWQLLAPFAHFALVCTILERLYRYRTLFYDMKMFCFVHSNSILRANFKSVGSRPWKIERFVEEAFEICRSETKTQSRLWFYQAALSKNANEM